MLSVIIARLREPSSFAGLAALFALFGINLAPEWANVVAQGAAAVSALLAIVLREKAR